MAKQQSKGTKTSIILFTSLRGLKHLAGFPLSLVSSPNGTKMTVPKSSFVQTSSMNKDEFFHASSMKKLLVERTIYEKVTKRATAM